MMSIPSVVSVVLLDDDGKRVAVKYYGNIAYVTSFIFLTQSDLLCFRDMQEMQFAFEKKLFSGSSHLGGKGEVELLILDDYVAVHKVCHDLRMYITATHDENELILVSVLETLHEALCTLLRGVVDKHSALENLDLVLLVIDELLDGGLILETDPGTIVNRVTMMDEYSEHNSAEQTISHALATAREQISRNLLR